MTKQRKWGAALNDLTQNTSQEMSSSLWNSGCANFQKFTKITFENNAFYST